MKVIVGLGNPGKKYENTRHNVGFLALDKIIAKLETQSEKQGNFKLEKKFDAEIAEMEFNNEGIILVKPQTFMNRSGESVSKIVNFFKIDPVKDLIIIHDDIDVELGKIKVKNIGSSGGHNGVQSIIDSLGTENFLRVRIGIDRPSEGTEVDLYVLGKFSKDEKDIVEKSIESFLEEVQVYLV